MHATLPDWLSSEKYLSLATWGLVFATSLLVLATLLLYLDGRSKAREQRKRWEKEDKDHDRELSELRSRWTREDEIRESQQALNYRFGIVARDAKVIVWVANLGSTSFLVNRVWLDIANPFNPSERLLRKKGFEWNAVVAAGATETNEFVLPDDFLLGSPVDKDEYGCGYHECEVSIGIDHLNHPTMSPAKKFRAGVDEEHRLEMFEKDFE
jgi:hypothetical protein